MKITITSTSMMQPMFESQLDLGNTVPTQRAYGILESASEDDLLEADATGHAQSFYGHPNTDGTVVMMGHWEDVQTIATHHQSLNFVVFGFYYAGEHDWLRVWVKSKRQFLWTQRPVNMTYRSYAALTMSALSKIPPAWDGVLHSSPFHPKSADPAIHEKEGSQSFAKPLADHTEAVVTDAAANEQGDLWFLVVLNSTFNKSSDHSQQVAASSGWIRASSKF